jgi:chromosome segregation ATPase
LEQRAALERRVAELSEKAAQATSERRAAESQLAGARATVGSLEQAFVEAETELKAIAEPPPAAPGALANDRKLAELRSSEASLRRKHEEASQAGQQFKSALEFAQRTRAQAEFTLGQLKAQLATLTAEIAGAEQRAAEERAAEERAARERNAAEEKALELARAHEKMTMELAMYEEQVSEANMARREADAKRAVAKTKLEQIVPQYNAARKQLQALEATFNASRDREAAACAERDAAQAELRAFEESAERLLIEQRLTALREAEDRAARELAEAELELRRLREAEESVAIERARIERSGGPMALPPASPNSVPMSIAGRIAGETQQPAAAYPAAPQAQGDGNPPPLRLSSLEDRRDSFTFFKWGRREVPALAPPPDAPGGGSAAQP